MTGRGGWPLSVFLTPEAVPFFGGSYWPPRPRQGMPGFENVPAAAADAWRNRRATSSARESKSSPPSPATPLAGRRRRVDRSTAGRRRSGARRGVRFGLRRIRPGPEIPPADQPHAPPPPLAAERQADALGDGRDNVKAYGPRRRLRSARRRIPPLQRRSAMARPPFREDALRQRLAGLFLSRGMAGHGKRRVQSRGPRDPRLCASRHDVAGRRLFFRRRRRQRRRGGKILPLDARGDFCRTRTRPGGKVLRGLRHHRGGQLRGPQHPAPCRDCGERV